jgi:uncharacterized membrane protein YhiD involved in acid resistance
MDWLNQISSSGAESSIETMITSLLAAFVLGQVLAWTYLKTHAGLSYSRSFTQSLVLIAMSASMVMFVIGNSLVTAFGLLGALAIIRFRNNLKDTRDIVFVFFSLIIGMAVGISRLPAAAVATLIFCLSVSFLHFSAFGTRGFYDGHLRCRLKPGREKDISAILHSFCLKFRQVSSSHGGDSMELVFEVLLRNKQRGDEFVRTLESSDGVLDAGLVVRDSLMEA